MRPRVSKSYDRLSSTDRGTGKSATDRPRFLFYPQAIHHVIGLDPTSHSYPIDPLVDELDSTGSHGPFDEEPQFLSIL